jgi:hypothetical protein
MTHPLLDPALAVEFTMREREALMGRGDWSDLIDRVLSWPLEYVMTDGRVNR